MSNKSMLDKEKMFQKIMPSATAKTDLSQNTPVNSPAIQNTEPSPSGGKLTQEQIAAMMAAANPEPEPAPQPPAPPEPQPVQQQGGKLTQEQIAAMMAAANPEPAPQPPAPPEPQPVQQQGGKLTQEQIAAMMAAANPEPEPAPQPPLSSDSLPSHIEEDTLPAQTSDEEVYPVNLAELIVERYYPRYRQKIGSCSCQKCADDVYAIALNKIKPHYIPSDQLTDTQLANKELISESVARLVKALFIVKRNPNH